MGLLAHVRGRAKSGKGHLILGHQSDGDLWARGGTVVIHFERVPVGCEEALRGGDGSSPYD